VLVVVVVVSSSSSSSSSNSSKKRRRGGDEGKQDFSRQNCCGCVLLCSNYFLAILLLSHACRKGEMETHSGTKDQGKKGRYYL
jgi:hypothetical protein